MATCVVLSVFIFRQTKVMRNARALTTEQIVIELIADVRTILHVAKPLTDKWNQRKTDLEQLNREITPALSDRLRQASREMDEALGKFR